MIFNTYILIVNGIPDKNPFATNKMCNRRKKCNDKILNVTNSTLTRVLFKAGFWNKNSNIVINKRQKKLLNKLLDGFDGKLTSSKGATIVKCSKDTAVRDINDLMDKVVLQKETSGGGGASYELKDKKCRLEANYRVFL